jgi:hypothetical protein
MIGGKACGMLLARAIIRNREPELSEVLEPHDSFYIGSDLYYTYIVDNGLWDLRIKQRTDEGYFSLAEEFATRLRILNLSGCRRATEQTCRPIEPVEPIRAMFFMCYPRKLRAKFRAFLALCRIS